jgi:hypothetical protein
MSFVTRFGGIALPLPTMTARAMSDLRVGSGIIVGRMLKPGDKAPDFPVGQDTLFEILKTRGVVVFFFPKAFTPG